MNIKYASYNNMVVVYIYWDTGFDGMPPMIKYIYNHNKEMSIKYQFDYQFVTDKNVYEYISETELPELYWKLASNFKSDIIRYHVLHKYGGIWLDTDIIVTKDVNKIYEKLVESGKDAMIDIEFGEKLGCASLVMKPNTPVSLEAITNINRILGTCGTSISWGELGPDNLEEIYIKYKENIIVNTYDIVKKGCNYICWNTNPGINRESWYLSSPEAAEKVAMQLMTEESCYYIITWTIYRMNNVDNIKELVFDDPCSIFYHIIKKCSESKQLLDNSQNKWYTENNAVNSIISKLKEICHFPVKILNIGYFDGKDVLALLNLYFKGSIIHTLDIHTDSTDALVEGEYDIIFCMHMLSGNKSTYNFNLYQNILLKLDKKLKCNGYLVMYDSQYNLEDSVLSDCYAHIKTPDINTEGVIRCTKFMEQYNDTISIIYEKIKYFTPKYAVLWASTINLGDDIQTLAAINFLKDRGITDYSFIDREKLKIYDGPPVFLIMNGWFMHDTTMFPPSNKITPILISFNSTNTTVIANNIPYFKCYAPVGCRDTATVELCNRYGIPAYFSGCLTLTFPRYEGIRTENIVIADVNSCPYIPNVIFDESCYTDSIRVYHDIADKTIIYDVQKRLEEARRLIDIFRSAKVVITSRLHCALPCRAFGTAVHFIHSDIDNEFRFTGLLSMLKGGKKIENTTLHIPYDDVIQFTQTIRSYLLPHQ